MPGVVDPIPVDEAEDNVAAWRVSRRCACCETSKPDDIEIVIRQANGKVQVTLSQSGREVELTKPGGVDWTLTLQGTLADLNFDYQIDRASLNRLLCEKSWRRPWLASG